MCGKVLRRWLYNYFIFYYYKYKSWVNSSLYKLYGQDQDNECCCMFEIQYFWEQLWRGCRNLILLQQNHFKFSLWNSSLLRLLRLLSDLVLHHHLTVLTQLFLVPLDAVLVIGELVNSIILFLQSVPSNFRCQTQISSDWSVNQTIKENYRYLMFHDMVTWDPAEKEEEWWPPDHWSLHSTVWIILSWNKFNPSWSIFVPNWYKFTPTWYRFMPESNPKILDFRKKLFAKNSEIVFSSGFQKLIVVGFESHMIINIFLSN